MEPNVNYGTYVSNLISVWNSGNIGAVERLMRFVSVVDFNTHQYIARNTVFEIAHLRPRNEMFNHGNCPEQDMYYAPLVETIFSNGLNPNVTGWNGERLIPKLLKYNLLLCVLAAVNNGVPIDEDEMEIVQQYAVQLNRH